jgi:hypothetical protein
MKRTYLTLLLLLGVVLAILLGLALQGFTRNTLVIPIAYAAWMADLIFQSLPGWLLWAWFMVIAVILALRSLRGRARDERLQRGGRTAADGPVRIWATKVSTISQGDYFRWHLAHDLAELALHFTAYRDRRGVARSERGDYIASLNAPPKIAAYLEAGLKPPPWQPVSPLGRVTQLVRRDLELTPLDIDLTEVVEYLEEQLETENDA